MMTLCGRELARTDADWLWTKSDIPTRIPELIGQPLPSRARVARLLYGGDTASGEAGLEDGKCLPY